MPIPTNSERAAIADAVAALIQAAVTAGTFGAVVPAIQRVYVAIEDLPNVPNTGPLVTIVPIGPETQKLVARDRIQKDLAVLVGIEQRLPQACDPSQASGNATIDAMDLFAEQVAAVLQPDPKASPPRTGILADPDGNLIAAWDGSKVLPYNYNRLREQRIYTSAITVNYLRH